MNYLVVVTSLFADNPSGSARVAWDIACLARDHGHNVAVLCTSTKLSANQSTKSEHDGVTVVRYGRERSKLPLLGREDYAKSIRAAFKNHLNGFTPDTIHLHSLLPACGLIEALGPNQPYVATIHSPVVPEQKLNWRGQGMSGRLKIAVGGLSHLRRRQQYVFDHCRRIHVLSGFTRSELLRYHNSLPECRVIPHWRRPDLQRTESKAQARESLKWPANRPVLFSLRRMVPRMGHAIAIKAIAPLLLKYDARMVLAGTGPLLENLRSLAAQTEGGDRIEFPGRISDEQMRSMYSGADLFVLPTLALECFGLIILEALSFGCPVLATQIGSIPEILDPILPDYLVPNPTVEMLRTKVERFFRKSLSTRDPFELVEYVEQNYGLAMIGPKLLDFLFGSAQPVTHLRGQARSAGQTAAN